jgi:hypothetical protein
MLKEKLQGYAEKRGFKDKRGDKEESNWLIYRQLLSKSISAWEMYFVYIAKRNTLYHIGIILIYQALVFMYYEKSKAKHRAKTKN